MRSFQAMIGVERRHRRAKRAPSAGRARICGSDPAARRALARPGVRALISPAVSGRRVPKGMALLTRSIWESKVAKVRPLQNKTARRRAASAGLAELVEELVGLAADGGVEDHLAVVVGWVRQDLALAVEDE